MTIGWRRLPLLAALVSIIGHELALAAGNSPAARLSSSLRATEHGPGWLLTVLALALATAAALVIVAWRIRFLRRRLVAASSAVPWSKLPGSADLLHAWLRIFALAIAAFLLQENLEHLLAHGHAPLLEPLVAGQYVATLPIFAALALLAAGLGLRLGRRIADLTAALSAVAQRTTRAHDASPRRSTSSTTFASPLAEARAAPRDERLRSRSPPDSLTTALHGRTYPERTRPMRIRSILAGVSIAALLAALPAVAAAHAELDSSTPEAGENLDTAPSEVTLTFDDELNPDGSSFTVVDADGHEVGSGEVDLTVADRNVMAGDVTITDAGVYTVEYTVVAADGHESGGTISFGYNAAEAIPDSTTDEPPNTALPRPSLPLAPLAGWLLVALAGVIGVRRLALR